jgi:hypothetical protein
LPVELEMALRTVPPSRTDRELLAQCGHVSWRGDHGATGFCKQLVAIDSQKTMPPARQAHVERGLLNVRVVVATRDFAWDKEKLDRFIAKPDEVVPGNNMKPYGGLTSAEARAKVIAFLESATDN